MLHGTISFLSIAACKLLYVSTSIEGKEDSTRLTGNRPRRSLWSI